MSQRYHDNTKRPKWEKNQQVRSYKSRHFAQEIQQRVLGPGEHCWGYISIYENTPENLLQLSKVQRRAQLKHSSHIVQTGVEATC